MRTDKLFPHPATSDGKTSAELGTLHRRCVELAQYINIVMPDSLEKSAAIEHLRETYEWARGGIMGKRG